MLPVEGAFDWFCASGVRGALWRRFRNAESAIVNQGVPLSQADKRTAQHHAQGGHGRPNTKSFSKLHCESLHGHSGSGRLLRSVRCAPPWRGVVSAKSGASPTRSPETTGSIPHRPLGWGRQADRGLAAVPCVKDFAPQPSNMQPRGPTIVAADNEGYAPSSPAVWRHGWRHRRRMHRFPRRSARVPGSRNSRLSNRTSRPGTASLFARTRQTLPSPA